MFKFLFYYICHLIFANNFQDPSYEDCDEILIKCLEKCSNVGNCEAECLREGEKCSADFHYFPDSPADDPFGYAASITIHPLLDVFRSVHHRNHYFAFEIRRLPYTYILNFIFVSKLNLST